MIGGGQGLGNGHGSGVFLPRNGKVEVEVDFGDVVGVTVWVFFHGQVEIGHVGCYGGNGVGIVGVRVRKGGCAHEKREDEG